jgi:hypothetical protein
VAENDGRAGHRALESLTIVLLGLAAIATAWSTFQATHWRSEQALAGNRSTAARVEASRAAGDREPSGPDGLTAFEKWLDAYASGDAERSAFVLAMGWVLFAGPLAWMATFPITV